MPKTLKSWPKSNKLSNLVTLLRQPPPSRQNIYQNISPLRRMNSLPRRTYFKGNFYRGPKLSNWFGNCPLRIISFDFGTTVYPLDRYGKGLVKPNLPKKYYANFVDVEGMKNVKLMITLLAITGQFIPQNRRGSERLRKQMLINTHKVNRCEWHF